MQLSSPAGECNVFIDIEIGIERVILETHRDVRDRVACPRTSFPPISIVPALLLKPSDGAEQVICRIPMGLPGLVDSPEGPRDRFFDGVVGP